MSPILGIFTPPPENNKLENPSSNIPPPLHEVKKSSTTVVDDSTGSNPKDASTGAPFGHTGYRTIEQQIKEQVDDLREEIAKTLFENGVGKAGAKLAKGDLSKLPLWQRAKLRASEPITLRDIAIVGVVVGGVVVVYQVTAYLLRNTVVLPMSFKFKTGKAADVRHAVNAALDKAKIPMQARA